MNFVPLLAGGVFPGDRFFRVWRRGSSAFFFAVFFIAVVSFSAASEDFSSLDGLFDAVTDIDVSQGTGTIGDGFSEYDDKNDASDLDGDLDALFSDAEDVSAEDIQQSADSENKNTGQTVASGGLNALLPQSSPLTFSGHLSAEVGFGYVWSERENSISGYFDFENDLTFSARASKDLAIRGNVKTEFPDFSFALSELYFDYLLFDRIFISGGKRLYRWGYIRLFDDDDEYDAVGRFQPNILYDSDSGIAASVTIPVWFVTFSGVALYSGTSDTPSRSALSYAGSLELKLGKSTVNFFGRTFPSVDSATNETLEVRVPPVAGLEAKRTVFGFDIYGQGQVRVDSFNKLYGFNKNGFSSMTATGGIMRVWDSQKPTVLANCEYQFLYYPQENDYTQKLAFVGAVSKIGPGEHMTVGVEWNHNITDQCGDVTPGVIVSGILPHARWKNAVEIYYGEDDNGNPISSPQVRLGTTLYLVMDY